MTIANCKLLIEKKPAAIISRTTSILRATGYKYRLSTRYFNSRIYLSGAVKIAFNHKENYPIDIFSIVYLNLLSSPLCQFLRKFSKEIENFFGGYCKILILRLKLKCVSLNRCSGSKSYKA